jgi:hypothetical protein
MVDEEIDAGDLDQAMAFSFASALLVALRRSAGTLLK